MSSYEKKRWEDLEEHWNKKAEKTPLLPPKARSVVESTASDVRNAAGAAGRGIVHVTPDAVKNAGTFVVDAALGPAVEGAVRLLELATDWAQELTDPKRVLEFHQGKGRDVHSLEDLRTLHLQDLDEMTRTMTLRCRTFGAAEGGTLGLLALIPVAGGALAITADLVVVHVLSTAIATRIAYAYGFDATDPDQRRMLERMIKRSYKQQAPKAGTLRAASSARKAGIGRQRWSEKLRRDEKLLAAVEKLMKQFTKAEHVPVAKAVKGLPVVSILAGAGTNSYVLGDVAKQAQRYAQTVWLAEKYGLPLPPSLALGPDPSDEEAE